MTSSIASSSPKYNFCGEILAKLTSTLFFFIIHIRPNLRFNFCNHTRLKRLKKILCKSKLLRSRGGGIKMLTMVGVQICQFLAKSDN